jgi:hypothetical protein
MSIYPIYTQSGLGGRQQSRSLMQRCGGHQHVQSYIAYQLQCRWLRIGTSQLPRSPLYRDWTHSRFVDSTNAGQWSKQAIGVSCHPGRNEVSNAGLDGSRQPGKGEQRKSSMWGCDPPHEMRKNTHCLATKEVSSPTVIPTYSNYTPVLDDAPL